MKRILMISSDYEPCYGGIGIHVKNLTYELIKLGYQITLLIGRMKTSSEWFSVQDRKCSGVGRKA